MQRLRFRACLTAAIATIGLLIMASIAQSANGGKFNGHLGQRCFRREARCKGHEPVAFTLKGGAVVGMHFTIQDRCPDGHTLFVIEGHYPAMGVVNSRFGGSFRPVPYHTGEGSIIKGTISGARASGSIKDTSFSKREHRLCHGKTTFTARLR
jgi:hypothetical protein